MTGIFGRRDNTRTPSRTITQRSASNGGGLFKSNRVSRTEADEDTPQGSNSGGLFKNIQVSRTPVTDPDTGVQVSTRGGIFDGNTQQTTTGGGSGGGTTPTVTTVDLTFDNPNRRLTVDVNGVSASDIIPDDAGGTTVVANPMGTDGDDLTRITIGDRNYNISGSSTDTRRNLERFLTKLKAATTRRNYTFDGDDIDIITYNIDGTTNAVSANFVFDGDDIDRIIYTGSLVDTILGQMGSEFIHHFTFDGNDIENDFWTEVIGGVLELTFVAGQLTEVADPRNEYEFTAGQITETSDLYTFTAGQLTGPGV